MVKGDIPNNGKVCLSSLGQVEKAILQYGKYYVSYDGKKGSIVDIDIYDNFSCSDNNSANVLFEADAEFICYNPDNCFGSEAIIENINSAFDKVEKGYEYDLLIDDVFVTKIFCMIDGNAAAAASVDYNKYIDFLNENNNLRIYSYLDLSGVHNIKIVNKQEIINNSFLVVFDYGFVSMVGFNFVEGQAHVLIIDENNHKYFDDNIDFTTNYLDGIYGTDNGGCRDTLPDIPELFDAIASGKKITTTITQVVGGKEIETIFNGEPLSYGELGQPASMYYWGQFAYQVDMGC